MFVLVNNELTVKTEAYLYDERSLLAEFGGALGLFLGFSFYMLWEIFEPIVNSLKKQIREDVQRKKLQKFGQVANQT